MYGSYVHVTVLQYWQFLQMSSFFWKKKVYKISDRYLKNFEYALILSDMAKATQHVTLIIYVVCISIFYKASAIYFRVLETS